MPPFQLESELETTALRCKANHLPAPTMSSHPTTRRERFGAAWVGSSRYRGPSGRRHGRASVPCAVCRGNRPGAAFGAEPRYWPSPCQMANDGLAHRVWYARPGAIAQGRSMLRLVGEVIEPRGRTAIPQPERTESGLPWRPKAPADTRPGGHDTVQPIRRPGVAGARKGRAGSPGLRACQRRRRRPRSTNAP